jgi:hypothetical protein
VERMRRAIRYPWRRSVVLVAAASFLVACGGGLTISTGTAVLPPTTKQSPTPPPNIASGRDCQNLSPVQQLKHGLEIQGRMRDGEPFYALFVGAHSAVRAGDHVRSYLHMPGARVLRATLVGPDGQLVRVDGLRPGLAPFRWDRPGDPWAGTMTFGRSGCWRIYVDRSGDDGEIWLHVR